MAQVRSSSKFFVLCLAARSGADNPARVRRGRERFLRKGSSSLSRPVPAAVSRRQGREGEPSTVRCLFSLLWGLRSRGGAGAVGKYTEVVLNLSVCKGVGRRYPEKPVVLEC